MVSNLDKIWKFTLDHEGGLCEDKDDPGGITKYGVDYRMLLNLSKIKSNHAWLYDLNVRLPVTRNSIVLLTKDQAKGIYQRVVWNPLGLNRFAYPIASVLFDAGVNHGNKKSVEFMQKAYNKHFNGNLAVDGILGPKSATAFLQDNTVKINKLADMALEERALWFARHVATVPTSKKFLKGWLNRVNDLEKYLGVG